MQSQGSSWVVLADVQGARLLRVGLTHRASCHVEQTAHTTGHRRWRARTGTATRPTATTMPNRCGVRPGNVLDWLGRQIDQHAMERVVLFAPPRFLGAVRKTKAASLNGRIEARQLDLMHLSRAALAEHPAIRKVINGAP